MIRARVFDAESPLSAANIELTIDSRRIRGSTYDRGTKLLSFRPPNPLGFGPHRVRVRADDPDGKSTTREWGFTIIR